MGTRKLLAAFKILRTRRRNRRNVLNSANADRAHIQNFVSDYVIGLGLLRQSHHYSARTNNARLLARIFVTVSPRNF